MAFLRKGRFSLPSLRHTLATHGRSRVEPRRDAHDPPTRGPVARAFVDLAVAAAFGMGAILLVYHPLVTSRLGLMHKALGDGRLVNYILEHGFRWLGGDPAHSSFWNPPAFHPYENVAAFSDLMVGALPLYGFWRILGAPADTAYQLFQVTVLAANFAALRMFLRRGVGVGNLAASAAAALIAVFHAIHFIKHPQLQAVFFVMLCATAIARLLDDAPRTRPDAAARRGWIAVGCASLVAQAWTGFYVFYFFGMLGGVIGLLAMFDRSVRGRILAALRGDPVAIGIAGLVASCGLAVLGIRYGITLRECGARSESEVHLPGLFSWILPIHGPILHDAWTEHFSLRGDNPARTGQGFGLAMLVAIALGFLAAFRSGRHRLPVLLGGGVLILMTMTTSLFDVSFWSLVREIVPGANAIRYVMRISMVAILPAAVALAIAVDEGRRRRVPVLVPLVAVALMAVELSPRFAWIAKDAMRAQIDRIAGAVDPDAEAFVLLCTTPGYRFPAEDSLWVQLDTGVPTISARYGHFPPSFPAGIQRASAIGTPGLADRLATRRGCVEWAERHGLDADRVQVIEYEADVLPALIRRARGPSKAAVAASSGTRTKRREPSSTAVASSRPRTSPIRFRRSMLVGLPQSAPTSLQFGPDERLYVAERQGRIRAYDIERLEAGRYRVTATETINVLRDIPNHDDDGTPRPDVTRRQVTGLLVTGTEESPVIWVASSDPRGPGESPDEVHVDTNSGVISRLVRDDVQGGWKRYDVVRGLPRASNDHATNGLQLDETARTLYVAQGGFTNMGAPSRNFGRLPEYALSAAILKVDLGAIGDTTYDLPTLDDEDRPGSSDANDPFGGNRGKNQAILLDDGPVTVHASGFRNPYDLVFTESGELYTIDNGPNAGWGAPPIMDSERGGATNVPSEPGTSFHDGLHRVTPGMYAGHPNPTRANPANTFNLSDPQSPVGRAHPEQAHFLQPKTEDGALASFTHSTNGITEYRSDAFGGRMRGDLLAISLDESLYRIRRHEGGTVTVGSLFHSIGKRSLDVTTLDDDSAFPGTIWIADLAGRAIHVFEPTDDVDDALATANDHDGDGYANDDERRNGTAFDNAADVPADFDGDLVSDLLDPDDDEDGIPDIDDPLALDPMNGRTTRIPFRREFTESTEFHGGLFGSGFTGLLCDGVHTYEDLHDTAAITAGGAGGLFTLDRIGAGDALEPTTVQREAFQFGVDLKRERRPVRIGARVAAPFAGLDPATLPSDAAIGLYIGTGDIDNLIRLALTPRDGGALTCISRVDGHTATDRRRRTNAFPAGDIIEPVALSSLDAIDLYLRIDPHRALAEPSYRTVRNGIAGERRVLCEPRPIPKRWLHEQSLVVGILATAAGSERILSASWHSLEVDFEASDPSAGAEHDDMSSTRAQRRAAADDPSDSRTAPDLPRSMQMGDLLWVRGEDAPIPRVESARIATATHLLVFGGFVNSSLEATARVEAYDPVADRWKRLADMPTSITHVTAATDGESVWFVGGFEGDHPGRATTRVSRYDIATDSWSAGPNLPEPRGGGGAAIVGGRLHFFGGLAPDRRTDCAEHWILDLADPTEWTSGAPMPVPRNHSGVTVSEGRIWVVGGQQGHDGGNTDLDVVHTYDPAADRWSAEAPLPAARSHNEGGTFVHEGRIVSLSGQKDRGTISNEIFVYSPKSKTWSLFGRIPAKMNGTAAAVFGDRLVVATGSVKGGKAPVATVWIARLD